MSLPCESIVSSVILFPSIRVFASGSGTKVT